MSVFSSRSSGYKVGVVLLFVAAILFVVGYASPFWVEELRSRYSEGLWMSCDETNCVTYDTAFDQLYAWFHAVRTLETVCLIGLVTSCVYCVITNCCRSVPTRRTRFLEVASALSGEIGFVGCIVYAVELPKQRDYHWMIMSWSFYLSAFGSALCVFAAITILVCNKPLLDLSPPGNAMTLTTISQGQGQGQSQGQGHAATGSHDNQAPPPTHSAPGGSTLSDGTPQSEASSQRRSYGSPQPSFLRQSERYPGAYEERQSGRIYYPPFPVRFDGNVRQCERGPGPYEGRQFGGNYYPPFPVHFDGHLQASTDPPTAGDPHSSDLLYSDPNLQSCEGRQSAGLSPPGYSPQGNSPSDNFQPDNFPPSNSGPDNFPPSNSGPDNFPPSNFQPDNFPPSSSGPDNSPPGNCGPDNSEAGVFLQFQSSHSPQGAGNHPAIVPRLPDVNPQSGAASQSVGKPESHDELQCDGDSQPTFELSQPDRTYLLPP